MWRATKGVSYKNTGIGLVLHTTTFIFWGWKNHQCRDMAMQCKYILWNTLRTYRREFEVIVVNPFLHHWLQKTSMAILLWFRRLNAVNVCVSIFLVWCNYWEEIWRSDNSDSVNSGTFGGMRNMMQWLRRNLKNVNYDAVIGQAIKLYHRCMWLSRPSHTRESYYSNNTCPNCLKNGT